MSILLKKPRLQNLSIVAYEPRWMKKNKSGYPNSPLQYGELALYLGEIPNAPGHCAVASSSGEVIWLLHPEDFRLAKDEEI